MWDEVLRQPPADRGAAVELTEKRRSKHAADWTSEVGERPASVLRRLRRLRERRDQLAVAPVDAIRTALDAFPEPWARRRALCFLLAEGIPAATDDALDLIADLHRATDRRWCLGVLGERGDLLGDRLDRALEMLDSPAARRRLVTRARAADSRR